MDGAKSINSTQTGDKSLSETEQLSELKAHVMSQRLKNRQSFESLQSKGIYINFALYNPGDLLVAKIELSRHDYYKTQLLSSVDKLDREAAQLAKLQVKHFSDQQQENQLEENLAMGFTRTYLFLRKTWEIESSNSGAVEDKLDRLNKIVANLKGGVQKTLRERIKPRTDSNDEILQHPCFERMRQELERALMGAQHAKDESYKALAREASLRQQIQRENSQLRRQLQSYKQKIQSLEANSVVYTQRINELTEKIYQSSAKQAPKTEQKDRVLEFTSNDFELQVRIPKELEIVCQSQKTSKTLFELCQFLESQGECSSGSQQNSNGQHSSEETGRSGSSNRFHRMRAVRNRGQSKNQDKQNITKMKFTRTSTLVTVPKLSVDQLKGGFIRTRADSIGEKDKSGLD